jgi:hypothetical protein
LNHWFTWIWKSDSSKADGTKWCDNERRGRTAGCDGKGVPRTRIQKELTTKEGVGLIPFSFALRRRRRICFHWDYIRGLTGSHRLFIYAIFVLASFFFILETKPPDLRGRKKKSREEMGTNRTLKGHTLLIQVPADPPLGYLDSLRERFPDLQVIVRSKSWFSADTTVTDDEYARTTIMMAPFAPMPMPNQVPRLELVQLQSAGANHLLEHPLFRDTEVLFCTANGVHGYVSPFIYNHGPVSGLFTLNGVLRGWWDQHQTQLVQIGC